jgi:hypothetical protein
MPDWHDITEACHVRTFDRDCRLDSLPHEWERKLAALWRLEADVHNGADLQFLSNWGHESYRYASQALKKIGARRMAAIIDRCQSLVDKHLDARNATAEQLQAPMPNKVAGMNGEVLKEESSILPEAVLDEIYGLSYEFMDYPESISELGLTYYASVLGAEMPG